MYFLAVRSDTPIVVYRDVGNMELSALEWRHVLFRRVYLGRGRLIISEFY
jgi:hypothetical protein